MLEVDARQLRGMVNAGHVAYQAARYGEVAVQLPALLARIDPVVRQLSPRHSEATALYVSGYVLAAKLCGRWRFRCGWCR